MNHPNARRISAVAFLAIMALSPLARADDTVSLPGAPIMDAIVRELLHLPGIGVVMEPILHPLTPLPGETKQGTTFRLAPTLSTTSFGLRAIATF